VARIVILAAILLSILSGTCWARENPILSLEDEFAEFLQQSAGRPFDQQKALWESLVEGPHQALYDRHVWASTSSRSKEERREELLRSWLPIYQSRGAAILARFRTFREDLGKHFARFRERFPEARLPAAIVAMPSLTFNGKQVNMDGHGPALLFGIDVMTERDENLGVLFSHELFHHYQAQAVPRDPEEFKRSARMTTPLWLEGLAVYVSAQFEPKGDVLMDPSLARVREPDVAWLAQRFLSDAELGPDAPGAEAAYRRWFLLTGTGQVRADLPPRPGYLLGYRAIEVCARRHSIEQMMAWDLDRVHGEMVSALKELAEE